MGACFYWTCPTHNYNFMIQIITKLKCNTINAFSKYIGKTQKIEETFFPLWNTFAAIFMWCRPHYYCLLDMNIESKILNVALNSCFEFTWESLICLLSDILYLTLMRAWVGSYYLISWKQWKAFCCLIVLVKEVWATHFFLLFIPFISQS